MTERSNVEIQYVKLGERLRLLLEYITSINKKRFPKFYEYNWKYIYPYKIKRIS